MTPTIEVRERRTGEVLTSKPLYEFLGDAHAAFLLQAELEAGAPVTDYFSFDELEILIDGEELLPEPMGHA